VGRAWSGTVEGFGLSVFVSDEFAEDYFANPRPGVTLDYFMALREGRRVHLTGREIAERNGGTGLNVLVLHFGSIHTDFAQHDTQALHALVGSSFFFAHGGYRVRSILAETYGPAATEYAKAGQFRVLADFAAQNPSAFETTPPDERPHLVGMRREWVQGAAWYPLAQLFVPALPRIYFRGTQRRVLERALLGEPDPLIAQALGISLHTVRSTWKSAIERAAEAVPGLFPGEPSVEGSRRGPEKRSHLIGYLREHMEELRPYPHPRRKRSARAAPRG
jgi:DNA-binding CsgD family transcriptional regulator